MYYLKMWILMVQIVELTVKLTLYSRCNIPVTMQLNKWVHIMCSTDDWRHAAISLSPCLSHQYKNNQHHCWLVGLLIGLLPDTLPFQWVVTRDWCSPRWPWESEGIGMLSLQSKNKISKGMNHTTDRLGHFSWSAAGCSVRMSVWEIHV